MLRSNGAPCPAAVAVCSRCAVDIAAVAVVLSALCDAVAALLWSIGWAYVGWGCSKCWLQAHKLGESEVSVYVKRRGSG